MCFRNKVYNNKNTKKNIEIKALKSYNRCNKASMKNNFSIYA